MPTYEEVRDAAYILLKSRGICPLDCSKAVWSAACQEVTESLTVA